MAIHQLIPDNTSYHGDYSPNRQAIFRIKAGDTIESTSLDAAWGLEAPHLDGTPRQTHPNYDPEVRGHALTGPIWIEGAHVGKTLVVHFEEMIPGTFGFTHSGGFPHRVNENLKLMDDGVKLMLWELDSETMTGTNQFGHRIKLYPFLGNLGMPPPEDGNHSTSPPTNWGGNIDCKELVVGTRLYLPIAVEGALFSFGDGHAAQGHGEVSVSAIECPMDKLRLRFEVIEDMPIDKPRAWTPAGWLTFGYDADLEKATFMALDEMLSLMVAQYGLESRKQALGLATALVDLHITQIANPLMGVHAFLAHDALID